MQTNYKYVGQIATVEWKTLCYFKCNKSYEIFVLAHVLRNLYS